MIRQFILILTLTATMVVMIALSALSASAQVSCEDWQQGYRWCWSSDSGWYKDYDA